ncbi:FliC/FljB family flagellin [Providencia sp. PROV033]|uniref:FliC/FljB family flagellin n=1 Tax=Providencia sp. PROV033 TaxID=2949765 RepID=UPI002349A19E|nr:FliC/FljB family flagellin [Providencia sp. PROV033]
MAQVINTNILSLTTQNNLNRSQGVLGSAIERLSSGSRINSAKDDAAGQAIVNRFTANVKGLTQAARNANDGISIAQTAEGAVNEINDNLQRVRELTVQAQNGTNTKSDIDSINKEVKARLDEIDRISNQTQFNGVNVLSQKTNMSIQVGANNNETISLNLEKVDSDSLGISNFKVSDKGAIGNEIKGNEAEGALNKAKEDPDAKNLSGMKVFESLDGSGLVEKSKVFVVGKNNKSEEVFIEVKIKDQTQTPTQYESAKKTNKPTSLSALEQIDKAMNLVDGFRSGLGAIQNRLQSTINNLNNSANNLSAARSRIQDADFATEVSNMSRGQILQQAGTAVLAHANQVPQGVLSLLR